jgi:hypothetical protein
VCGLRENNKFTPVGTRKTPAICLLVNSTFRDAAKRVGKEPVETVPRCALNRTSGSMMTRCLVSWARGEAWVETTRTTRADACEKKHLFREEKKAKRFHWAFHANQNFQAPINGCGCPGGFRGSNVFFMRFVTGGHANTGQSGVFDRSLPLTLRSTRKLFARVPNCLLEWSALPSPYAALEASRLGRGGRVCASPDSSRHVAWRSPGRPPRGGRPTPHATKGAVP